MGERVAVYLQRGVVAAEKQTAACLQYIGDEDLDMVSVVPHHAHDQLVRMVHDGLVHTIVVAFDSRLARQLAVDIEGHGRVIYVHPTPTEIDIPRGSSLPGVEELIVRWYRSGRTPHEIAEDLGGDTADVAAVLRRGGKYPDRSD